jgi:hypothetical protein
MRSKLVLALILFGAVITTTASVSMPQKAHPLSQKLSLPKCDCAVEIQGHEYPGVWDSLRSICYSDVMCIMVEE